MRCAHQPNQFGRHFRASTRPPLFLSSVLRKPTDTADLVLCWNVVNIRTKRLYEPEPLLKNWQYAQLVKKSPCFIDPTICCRVHKCTTLSLFKTQLDTILPFTSKYDNWPFPFSSSTKYFNNFLSIACAREPTDWPSLVTNYLSFVFVSKTRALNTSLT